MGLHIIDQILNDQLEKNIAPLLLLGAAGFVKGGGLDSIVGSSSRRKELESAEIEQRERQYDYENFDYNQDVGAIENPYAELAQKKQEFAQSNIDSTQANALQAQQNAGNFGATQAILNNQNKATQKAGLDIDTIRTQGKLFVDKQRQTRIQDKYNETGTLLGRADTRLASAEKAKKMAQEKLISGIAGGVTAAAGGLAGGGGLSALKAGTFDAKAAFKGSGLLPSQVTNPTGLSAEQLTALQSQLTPKVDEEIDYSSSSGFQGY